MELLEMLTSQLGITEEQAKGGAGLLFKMAKEKLDSGEFSEVSGSIPGIEGLISSAPQLGMVGKLMSSLQKEPSGLGNLVGLAGGFKKLGLNPEIIGKFLPVILSFAQSKGGDNLKGILEKVMK